jgi:hypothetical protein
MGQPDAPTGPDPPPRRRERDEHPPHTRRAPGQPDTSTFDARPLFIESPGCHRRTGASPWSGPASVPGPCRRSTPGADNHHRCLPAHQPGAAPPSSRSAAATLTKPSNFHKCVATGGWTSARGRPLARACGWAYQWIAQLSFERDSWTAPVDARRLHPTDDTDQTATAQIHALLTRLPVSQAPPLFVFDGGYDSAPAVPRPRAERAAVLVRLRSDRCSPVDGQSSARRVNHKLTAHTRSTWLTPARG